MYKIYFLINEARNRTYIGFTNDIVRRIKEHQGGQVKSTSNFGQFTIEILENVSHLEAARKREKYWKSGAGRKKLRRFFQ